MTQRALIVFARLPEAGTVKTRMTPPLTPRQAADLYTAMLGDVLETSAEVCASATADLFVTITPADRLLQFSDLFAGHTSLEVAHLVAQCEGSLGVRMHHAFAQAAAAGYDRIILRGSDSPALPAGQLQEAFEALEEVDLAIGPDLDGGYNWIAARRAHTGLLDHEMSTSSVSEKTLEHAERLGLRSRVFEPSFDLDTASDLERLRGRTTEFREGVAQRTRAWLESSGAASCE
ncbi:MAG: TIGR04282 family arsenosugar biosynthesis glycosyltransferase [Myxococcota bacterium]|nr:TIGR04282 family arsenosugar biosynthesis glycosyltransferase [Myxococcota bacterium]